MHVDGGSNQLTKVLNIILLHKESLKSNSGVHE